MLSIEDISILADFEEAEKSKPSPQKIVGDRVIDLFFSQTQKNKAA